MKTPRLTKKLVLAEVVELRKQINHWTEMANDDFKYSRNLLKYEYLRYFPANIGMVNRGALSAVEMLRSLIISATYNLTNVLDIE